MMKLFRKSKDGGPDSTSTGYWLIEWKPVFSIVLLKFDGDSREAYHSHAFNSVSWLLRGKLIERIFGGELKIHRPSFKSIITKRSTFHRVDSDGVSWAISFRGPWAATWKDMEESTGEVKTLTWGRKEVQ